MLGKLLKYEVKATARWFLPMYIGILAFAILNKIVFSIGNVDAIMDIIERNKVLTVLSELFSGISIALYVLIIAATFVLTLVITIQRFYKNLMGDEGYLMFTLPVTPTAHIWSKFLVSLMWSAVSVLVTGLSIFILAFYGNMFHDIAQVIQEISSVFQSSEGIHLIGFILELFICLIVGECSSTLMVYASIALGHTRKSHKVLYSFGAYMLINAITSIISGIFTAIGTIGLVTDDELLYADTIANNTIFGFFHYMFISTAVLSALFAVGFFIITNFILSKKLNLE